MHASFQTVMFSRFELRSGVAGSHGPSVHFFQEPPHYFHRGCTLVHPHSECRRIPYSVYLLQHLFFGDLSDGGHSDLWRGVLTVDLISTDLIISRSSLARLSSKESACSARDVSDAGSIPGSGRSPGEGNDNPLQYSFLENSMDRGD